MSATVKNFGKLVIDMEVATPSLAGVGREIGLPSSDGEGQTSKASAAVVCCREQGEKLAGVVFPRSPTPASGSTAVITLAIRLFADRLQDWRDLPGGETRPTPSPWKRVASVRSAACTSRLFAHPQGAQSMHCLPPRSAVQKENSASPAMTWPPTNMLLHTGRRRNERTRLPPTSRNTGGRMDSSAWRALRALWPIPGRRSTFVPSR